jgi:hypothetical protein
MAGPPNDITPAELFQQLSTMPRPHQMVDFPRKAPGTNDAIAKVPIWPLRESELLAAQASATSYVHDNLKLQWGEREPDHGYKEVYNNAVATEILQRACRRAKLNAESGEWEPQLNLPLFPKASDVRAQLTHDEISVLFSEYMLVQRSLGPIVNDLSKEECEAWLKVLSEGGRHAGLPFLSWGALIDLVNFMVSQIKSLQTELSSAGSPQNDTSSEPVSE